jgi:aryl-alcohol dehydrogenase-like predicted oxidoreductase
MTALPTRKLGPFTVSSIGLGCMNLSHAYGTKPSEEQGIALLNAALDMGITLLDTAALYGLGANERLVGKAVMHRRQEFTLASKCVLDMREGKRILDGRPESIARTLDEALIRLGTDVIDLYYLHRLDKNVPIEDSVGALVRAKEAGKIRTMGLSEVSASTIRRAQAVHPITAVQSEYSPWTRNVEVSVLETCKELGIALVAFSPVARGFLAGAVTEATFEDGDLRLSMPRFHEANLNKNLSLFERFSQVARAADITPAQLSLAWVLSRGDHVIPIPGTRSIDHLREDVQAAHVRLHPSIIAAVDEIFRPGAVAGPRYPASAQAQIDTELLPEEI